MAVLRLSTGEVITGYSEINELIVPAGMEVGSFAYPDSLQAKVAAMAKPLDQEGADLMFGELSSSVESVVKNLDFNFSYRRAAVYVPPKESGGTGNFSLAGDDQSGVAAMDVTRADIDNYMAPHILRENNLHFAFTGAFVKGMQLKGDLQAMIYVTAGEWQRLDPNILTWVIFAYGEPVVGLSFFGSKPDANGMHETEVIANHSILESMNF